MLDETTSAKIFSHSSVDNAKCCRADQSGSCVENGYESSCSDKDEEEEEELPMENDVVDVEDIGAIMRTSEKTKKYQTREMVTPLIRQSLTKQG